MLRMFIERERAVHWSPRMGKPANPSTANVAVRVTVRRRVGVKWQNTSR